MPKSVLARIRERQPTVWTAALVEGLLVEAFRQFPGRGIRVLPDHKLFPTHAPWPEPGPANILQLAAICLPERQEREILFYFARRKATKDGINHSEAAAYYGFQSRKGLLGVRKRAAAKLAACLNDRNLVPKDAIEGLESGEKDATAKLSFKVA